MKTLNLSVGLLLLLTVYCCTAMPHGVNEIAPATCCFKFFSGRIPAQQIISIIKTNSQCQQKGFVVSTARGKQICVGQNANWAQTAFEGQQVTRG